MTTQAFLHFPLRPSASASGFLQVWIRLTEGFGLWVRVSQRGLVGTCCLCGVRGPWDRLVHLEGLVVTGLWREHPHSPRDPCAWTGAQVVRSCGPSCVPPGMGHKCLLALDLPLVQVSPSGTFHDEDLDGCPADI